MLLTKSEISMMAGAVVLPLHTAILKTAQGLIVISPSDFTTDQVRQIEALGTVTALVAPSLIHHLYMSRAIARWPTATVWGPPGCEKKLPAIRWDKVFGRDEWPYDGEVGALFVDGVPRLNEILFLDRGSRTMIATDFCFNLKRPKGWAAPLVLRLLGTYGEFAVSRLINKFMVDRVAFDASVQKLLAWNFERIAMSHGDPVENGGKKKLETALAKRGLLALAPHVPAAPVREG